MLNDTNKILHCFNQEAILHILHLTLNACRFTLEDIYQDQGSCPDVRIKFKDFHGPRLRYWRRTAI